MLKKIISDRDVRNLHIGDVLVDRENGESKSFVVENVSDGIVYAIHEEKFRLLKLLLHNTPPDDNWWLIE